MGPWYDQNASTVGDGGPPPIGPDGSQPRLHMDAVAARSRRARAEAFGAAGRALGRGLLTALGVARTLVSCAGAGAAKRVPDGLTTGCR